MEDFQKVNSVYGEFFNEHKPARRVFAAGAQDPRCDRQAKRNHGSAWGLSPPRPVICWRKTPPAQPVSWAPAGLRIANPVTLQVASFSDVQCPPRAALVVGRGHRAGAIAGRGHRWQEDLAAAHWPGWPRPPLRNLRHVLWVWALASRSACATKVNDTAVIPML